jgi:DnaJ-class molecular chaperone
MPFERKCYPCRGHGYHGYDRKDICPVCQGRGSIVFKGSTSDYQECRPCSGWGYFDQAGKDLCKVCNGIALVTRVYAD